MPGKGGSPKTDRLDYGIDAPGVIRTLATVGIVGVAGIALALIFLSRPAAWIILALATMAALAGLGEAVLMLLYAKRGKFRHRDRMLAKWHWRGDEQVLDIGTGRGLLLIGAAKRLDTGRGVGLDIWNPSDLSGNARDRTLRNLAIEGVAARCTLVSEPAQAMPFADRSFDVVLSNLCLHNIAARRERDKACREIVRVPKPGGVAVISDFRFTQQYADSFGNAGLAVAIAGPFMLDTFPPLRIVVASHKLSSES